MPLRRYQPISRSGQWSETVDWPDPRTRKLNSLDGAVLTLGLYQRSRWGFRDYGRVWHEHETPVVKAQTQADGSGPFFILPDLLHAQFVFPASALGCLHPGDAELVIWVTVDGATEVITQTTLQVLDGPRCMSIPILPPVVDPPPVITPPGTSTGGALDFSDPANSGFLPIL